jgi:hypothetical protein
MVGLQSLCGAAPIDCTSAKLGHYLGLEVNERPMDIHFKLYKSNNQITIDNNTIIIPASPRAYQCNESYEFPNIEYGAKCSCQVSFCQHFL